MRRNPGRASRRLRSQLRNQRARPLTAACLAAFLVATLLTSAGGIESSLADRANAPGPAAGHPPVSNAVPFDTARRHRDTARMRIGLSLRDAALVRAKRGRLALAARPGESARLVITDPRKRRLRLPARSLAIALDGLAGRSRIRARIGERPMVLTAPRFRRGRLVARARRTGRRPEELGSVRLRAEIVRRGVHRRGRCTLLPFESCPRARLPLVDMLYADLRGIDLRRADLQRAYAHGANLASADLRGADLRGADLSATDLRRADLRGANLTDAHLRFARLKGARMDRARLCRTRMPKTKGRTRRHCGRASPRIGELGDRALRPLPPPRRSRALPSRRSLRDAAPSGRSRDAAARAATPDENPPDPPLIPADQGCIFYSNTKDYDKDGLSDCFEATGRNLPVTSADDLNRDGRATDVTGITSSTTDPDTDDDGLRDGAEFKLGSHPGRRDTDNDGLADKLEWCCYATNLAHADDDGDSIQGGTGRDQRLYDGAEALISKTSPTDPDSDGDGMTDYVEIRNVGETFNPREADLPHFKMEVEPKTPVDITIDIEETVGESTTKETSHSSVHRSEVSESHGFEVELGLEFEQEVEGKTTIGLPHNEAEMGFKLSSEESITTSTTHEWERTHETEDENGRIEAKETSHETKVGPGGCIEAELRFTNLSDDIGFQLKTPITVLAQTADPKEPDEALTLGTLQPVTGTRIGENPCPGTEATTLNLDPGSTVTHTFASVEDARKLRNFMAQPSSITFRMGSYEIVGDQNGKPFVKTLQDVNARTANIVVDRGPCAPRDADCKPEDPNRIQQYQVATTGPKVRIDGGARDAGITADEALRAVGLVPEYGPGKQGRGREKLVGLDGLRDQPNPNAGTWIVMGTGKGIADDDVNFPDIGLKAGDTLILTYMSDHDDDGVPSMNEQIHGTDDGAKDTDGDGLTDEQETQVGWTVPLPDPAVLDENRPSSYRVFSSPLSCDADADGSPDGPGDGTDTRQCPDGPPESTRGISVIDSADKLTTGTDPKRADTNQDGRIDGKQAYPQVLQNVPPGARAPAFVTMFGVRGSGGGGLNNPEALAIDRFGDQPTAWVNDPVNRLIQPFQISALPFTHLARDIRHTFTGDGRTQRYSGVVVTGQKTTEGQANTDTTPGQVLYTGSFRTEEVVPGVSEASFGLHRFNAKNGHSLGHDYGTRKMKTPGGRAMLDVDSSNNVYVALTGIGNSTSVYKYDPGGREVGADGAFRGLGPVSGLAISPKDDVYITQEGAKPAIRMYDASGSRVEHQSTGPPFASGVGVDRNGYVYIPDASTNTVMKFSRDLTYLTSFGGKGTTKGRFRNPNDVDADRDGTIYVLDSANDRVQVFTYPFGEGPPQ